MGSQEGMRHLARQGILVEGTSQGSQAEELGKSQEDALRRRGRWTTYLRVRGRGEPPGIEEIREGARRRQRPQQGPVQQSQCAFGLSQISATYSQRWGNCSSPTRRASNTGTRSEGGSNATRRCLSKSGTGICRRFRLDG